MVCFRGGAQQCRGRATPAAALLVMLCITAPAAVLGRKARNVQELSRCVRMAEPLVHNPDYVFPLTNQEIHGVCRMWGSFVDCVRSYTENFLNPDQLEAFGAAIEPSMQSIHQLCAEDHSYRKAYLEYAPCMKLMYTSRAHCGGHYQYLADLVQGSVAPQQQMCCAHHKFRSCVLSETPRECGATISEGNITATQFVTSMLDRALGFLLQQCTAYQPNEQECPGSELSNSLDGESSTAAAGGGGAVRDAGYRSVSSRSSSVTDGLASAPPSPYSPTTSRDWSPSAPTKGYPVRPAPHQPGSGAPWQPAQDTERLHPGGGDSPFRTHTNYNRGFRGSNGIDDEPKTEQFLGTSSAGRLRSVTAVWGLLPLALIALQRAG